MDAYEGQKRGTTLCLANVCDLIVKVEAVVTAEMFMCMSVKALRPARRQRVTRHFRPARRHRVVRLFRPARRQFCPTLWAAP